MRKKIWLCLTALLLAWMLVGCASLSAEDAYQLPKPPAEYENLVSAVAQTKKELAAQSNASVEEVAPTATEQGYTLHTCSVCGYSYKDQYVAPLGEDFPVHFSVPAGVTAPADMTFLGWVLEDYDNVETRPAVILSGNYIAPAEITLRPCSPGSTARAAARRSISLWRPP